MWSGCDCPCVFSSLLCRAPRRTPRTRPQCPIGHTCCCTYFPACVLCGLACVGRQCEGRGVLESNEVVLSDFVVFDRMCNVLNRFTGVFLCPSVIGAELVGIFGVFRRDRWSFLCCLGAARFVWSLHWWSLFVQAFLLSPSSVAWVFVACLVDVDRVLTPQVNMARCFCVLQCLNKALFVKT